MTLNEQLLKGQEIRRTYKDVDLAIQAIESNEVSLELFIKYGSNLIFNQTFMDTYKTEIENTFALDMLIYKFNILSDYDIVGEYISIVLSKHVDDDNTIRILSTIIRSQYYFNLRVNKMCIDLTTDIHSRIDLVNKMMNNIYGEYIDIIIDHLMGKDIKLPSEVLNTRQLFK